MKLSLNWIKDYVKIPEDMDLSRLAYDLTMSTVEVEGAENLAERFDKIRPAHNLCFLCDYSLFAHPEGDNCSSCPLLSKDQPFADMCLNGLYFDVIDYFHEHDFKKASETALKIAFLPVVN